MNDISTALGTLFLFSLGMGLVGLFVLYWVIRLAVKHGTLDAQYESSKMFSGYGGHRPDDQ